MSSLSTVSALILPLFLAYVLIFVRLFERRRTSAPQGRSFSTLLNIRDAAIATLALDLAELTRLTEPLRLVDAARTTMLIVFALLFLHVSLVIVAGTRDRDVPGPEAFWPRLVTTYIALALLMTNAVTILRVIDLAGRAR